jgi:hypothetical protein
MASLQAILHENVREGPDWFEPLFLNSTGKASYDYSSAYSGT